MNAAGGDPVDPERPGLSGGDGAIRQTPSPDAQRVTGYRVQQVAFGLDVPAAAGAVGCAGF